MNHHLEKNCEGVDASVFSGDVLYDDESRAELKNYIGRWTRAIAEHEGAAVQAAQPPEPMSAPTADARKPDDVDLLLRAVFALCEATEEAPEVEPKNEHQRGFDKGRRFEAKSIRRAVGDWFQATFCGQSFMGEPVLTKPNLPHCVDGACSVCAARPLTATRSAK